jgi:Spy/CpxP family protein refolding chaperone
MKMKNLTMGIISLILLTATSYAQRRPLRERFEDRKDQIKAMKIAFITTELDLTSDEAVKFWPIFNAFEDKQQEIRKQKLRSYLDRTDGNSLDRMSEKEAANLMNQIESTEDELYQLKKKFLSNLKGILPSVKILKLKRAEDQFNKRLLQQYRDNREDRK